jgi:hypothetical protein
MMNRQQLVRRISRIDKAHSVMDFVKMAGFIFWCLSIFSMSFFGVVDLNTYIAVISTIIILVSRGLSVLLEFWGKKLKMRIRREA